MDNHANRWQTRLAIVAGIVGVVFAGWSIWHWWNLASSPPIAPEARAQLGDYLGGVTAPPLAMATTLLFLASLFFQSSELALQRAELKESRVILRDQADHIRAQAEYARQQARYMQSQAAALSQQTHIADQQLQAARTSRDLAEEAAVVEKLFRIAEYRSKLEGRIGAPFDPYNPSPNYLTNQHGEKRLILAGWKILACIDEQRRLLQNPSLGQEQVIHLSNALDTSLDDDYEERVFRVPPPHLQR